MNATISSIRAALGVDDNVDGNDTERKPNKQGLILGRAVALLSDALYSKDVHFLLELIQNAEDNSYAAGVTPSLSFVLAARDPTDPSN